MGQPKQSRIRNQRVDIKISPDVYQELVAVKALLEQVKSKSYSMSEVVGLLCQWSEPQIAELGDLRAKLDALATKKEPPKNFN
jgi:predicted CopG family antitoxin